MMLWIAWQDLLVLGMEQARCIVTAMMMGVVILCLAAGIIRLLEPISLTLEGRGFKSVQGNVLSATGTVAAREAST